MYKDFKQGLIFETLEPRTVWMFCFIKALNDQLSKLFWMNFDSSFQPSVCNLSGKKLTAPVVTSLDTDSTVLLSLTILVYRRLRDQHGDCECCAFSREPARYCCCLPPSHGVPVCAQFRLQPVFQHCADTWTSRSLLMYVGVRGVVHRGLVCVCVCQNSAMQKAFLKFNVSVKPAVSLC